MGAGASAQPEVNEEEPRQRALPTRKEACDASFATLQGMVTRSGVGFARARDVNDRSFDLKGGGVLWCDSRGIYLGRHRHQQSAAVSWGDNITFTTKKDGLMVNGDSTQWRIELNGKSEVAAWLACYLHAFAPITEYTQSVTFTEWGQLGIAFGVFMKRVIPVVFSVEGAALSNDVRPASELVSVNGRKVESLGDEDDLLEFVSSASFPKTCVFRRRALSGFHAPPPREPEPEPEPSLEPELLPPSSEPPEP